MGSTCMFVQVFSQLIARSIDMSATWFILDHSGNDVCIGLLASEPAKMENQFDWKIKITNTSWTNLSTWKVSKFFLRSTSRNNRWHFSLDRLPELEYYPVRVRGKFDHSREILVEPRSRLDNFVPENHGTSRQAAGSPTFGAHVVTPFRVANRK